jgi:hypothetical protein
LSSLVVVLVPLVLGIWVGSATNFVVGILVFFGASWVLGMMWQKDRGQW